MNTSKKKKTKQQQQQQKNPVLSKKKKKKERKKERKEGRNKTTDMKHLRNLGHYKQTKSKNKRHKGR
jgi:hypothetical protein